MRTVSGGLVDSQGKAMGGEGRHPSTTRRFWSRHSRMDYHWTHWEDPS